MHKITLVCSAHRESGRCNAGELLEILRAIEPEVVFEEFGPSEFDYLYRQGSVEAHAVARYRQSKSAQPVPVDRHGTPANLLAKIKAGFDRVLEYVEQASQEYVELNEENAKRQFEEGFTYLNSDACAILMERAAAIEDEAVSAAGDQELTRSLGQWRQLVQRRERQMIRNIYEYCKANAFETGVFLVGAAHKTNMAKEIEKYTNRGEALILWKLCR